MNKKGSSCYNCDKRKVGCHSDCEIYKNYKTNLDVINSRRREILCMDRVSWRCRLIGQ